MSEPLSNATSKSCCGRHLQGRGICDAARAGRHGPDAARAVRRRASRTEAYADRALAIACGQTISQPYIVALMTQALALHGGERVLEIGTGSGYQTAMLAELAREVMSIERHAELSRQAAAVLAELGYTRGEADRGRRHAGLAGRPPTIASSSPPPRRRPAHLIDQLAAGGILVIPLGDRDQQMLQAIRKVGDEDPGRIALRLPLRPAGRRRRLAGRIADAHFPAVLPCGMVKEQCAKQNWTCHDSIFQGTYQWR